MEHLKTGLHNVHADHEGDFPEEIAITTFPNIEVSRNICHQFCWCRGELFQILVVRLCYFSFRNLFAI